MSLSVEHGIYKQSNTPILNTVHAAEKSYGVIPGEASTSAPKPLAVPQIDRGSVGQGYLATGRIYSNNENVILLFEDGSIWLSENGEHIIVQEYVEGGIMNMIPKNGIFNKGTVENGRIQKVI